MTEWNVVLLVFWVMWLADGLRHAPADLFNFTALARRARATHARWHWPTWWPGGWRVTGEDIPFSFSSRGICNRPAATAGRPTERPRRATAWRWEEIESAVIEKGWLVINGARFCRDTGHLNASGVLALASAASGVGWIARSGPRICGAGGACSWVARHRWRRSMRRSSGWRW